MTNVSNPLVIGSIGDEISLWRFDDQGSWVGVDARTFEIWQCPQVGSNNSSDPDLDNFGPYEDGATSEDATAAVNFLISMGALPVGSTCKSDGFCYVVSVP